MVADALSRIHAATIDFIDFHHLAKDQSSSIEIKAYRTAITGLVLQDVPLEDTTFVCDVSLGKPRPVIPRECTHKVFATVHSLSHSEPRPTQRAIADQFVWHGLKKDVKKWCKDAAKHQLLLLPQLPSCKDPTTHQSTSFLATVTGRPFSEPPCGSGWTIAYD